MENVDFKKCQYINSVKNLFRMPRTSLLRFVYRIKYLFVKPQTDLDKLKHSWAKKILGSCLHDWEESYYTIDIDICYNPDNGLSYVVHQGKKLYFRRDFSVSRAKQCYRALLIEQDPRSAHRYVRDYAQLEGKVLLDIGSAEGIFALEVIEDLSYLYLFECEECWIEALEATFAPWNNKVAIVPKYVTNTINENSITIDEFLANVDSSSIFLKMDIEGYEGAALEGAKKLLRENDGVQGTITIYHKAKDEEEFSELFRSLGFNIEIQEGYLRVRRAFRRGILRFWR